MNTSGIEIADVMEEMEASFVGMSEEAKEGADYAQNSNNEAYDIMMKSEKERVEVGERADAVEIALMEKIEQSKAAEKILDLTADIIAVEYAAVNRAPLGGVSVKCSGRVACAVNL